MPEGPSERLRINQAIAKTGLCSRRKADELIAAGRVKLNGKVVSDFSTPIDIEKDVLSVDGKTLKFKHYLYIALNKPRGVVTTMSDERGRETVIDLLPPKLRHLKPVGRLDMYSEGLLIMTNDGELALRLTHPRQHVPKLYEVTVEGDVSESSLKQIKTGVPLEDGVTLPAKARIISRNKTSTTLQVVLREGRNRQIRRMFDHLGHRVLRLARLAIGGLQLGDVKPGTWRYLTSQEVSQLLQNTKDT